MRELVGVVARLVFWALALYIVGAAVQAAWSEGRIAFAVLEVIFFPVTYFVSPWFHGHEALFFASILAYAISTNVGRLPPVG